MVFLSGIESPFLRCFNKIYVNCFKWLQQSDCISHSIPMNYSLNHYQTSIFLTVKWTISMSGPRIWNLPSQHRWVNGLDEPMATIFWGNPPVISANKHGDFMGLNQHKRLLDRIETTEMVIWWDIIGISWGYLWAIKHGWEIPKLNGGVSGKIIELLQKDTKGGFSSDYRRIW